MLQDSKDEMVQTTRVEIIPGRKWSTRKPSLKLSPNGDIERRWKEWQMGRRDFMSHQQDKWRTASVKGKGKLVQREVRRLMRAAGMEKQGNWLNWEGSRQVRVRWIYGRWNHTNHSFSWNLCMTFSQVWRSQVLAEPRLSSYQGWLKPCRETSRSWERRSKA